MNRREQLAWLAGLIDGEGCISLTRRSPQRKHRCVSPSYRLILKVSMCHLATVRRCREITGLGSLHMQDVQKKHYSSAYTWFCNATDAELVIEAVMFCQVLEGLDKVTLCPELHEFIRYNEIRLYGENADPEIENPKRRRRKRT